MSFGETKLTKEKFAAKKPIKLWDINVEDIAISKSIETITNSKYLIGYLDKPIRPLVLIVPKMSGLLRHLKLKVEIKIKNNQLMLFVLRLKT